MVAVVCSIHGVFYCVTLVMAACVCERMDGVCDKRICVCVCVCVNNIVKPFGFLISLYEINTLVWHGMPVHAQIHQPPCTGV